jgi:hypothetical protein
MTFANQPTLQQHPTQPDITVPATTEALRLAQEATAFIDWVMLEVLPTIRKTGTYSLHDLPELEAFPATSSPEPEVEKNEPPHDHPLEDSYMPDWGTFERLLIARSAA